MLSNETTPELEALTEKLLVLSDSLRDAAQLCLNQSAIRQYNPGSLIKLKNAFGMIDKRLKLAKSAANEFEVTCSEPFTP